MWDSDWHDIAKSHHASNFELTWKWKDVFCWSWEDFVWQLEDWSQPVNIRLALGACRASTRAVDPRGLLRPSPCPILALATNPGSSPPRVEATLLTESVQQPQLCCVCIACSSSLQCAPAVERATPETGRCAFKEVRACKWATPLLVYWLFRRRGEIVKDFLLAFFWDFDWNVEYLYLNI